MKWVTVRQHGKQHVKEFGHGMGRELCPGQMWVPVLKDGAAWFRSSTVARSEVRLWSPEFTPCPLLIGLWGLGR